MTVETAIVGARPRSFRTRPSNARLAFLARQSLARWAASDLARLSLWTPVAIGLGAGVYFGLKVEPDWRIGVLLLVASAIAAVFPTSLKRLFVICALVAAGFVAADFRTAYVAAPQLTHELGIVETTGRLISIEEGLSGRRYVLAITAIEGLASEQLPARARITWRGKTFDAAPGDLISVRAGLAPAPPPVAPGSFDFARQLYFQRIGAVGYAVSAPRVDAYAERSRAQRVAASIETMRFNLFKRITNSASGQGGAVIAAIVTGKRDAISEQSEAALRDAGLAHLLAISGLHMGLATGLVFFTVRFGLAAIEPLALRFPIKKWAAAAALASGFFYLVLSGGGWSARRAFIMAAIMFAAILVDRRALSLRNVAVAAVVILLTTPEALFHPGFQMSFAAVTALIAAYEWMSAHSNPDRSFSIMARTKRYAISLALTDLIAAIATAPYALFHFNRVAIYSLPANMAAMPLMGLWIVPAAILALVLSPLGLDAWAWRLAAFGMDTILNIATTVSSWRGAVSLTKQWPLIAMLTLTGGGMWLCLSRAPWRIAGLVAIPVAVLIVVRTGAPQLFIAPSGLNAALVAQSRDDETVFIAHSRRRDKFAIERWKEVLGLPENVATLLMKDNFSCDSRSCVGTTGSGLPLKVAFVSETGALAEDCQRADVVVVFYPVNARERSACQAEIIDRRSVWRFGAHTVRVTKDGRPIITTASEQRGQRPWTGTN